VIVNLHRDLVARMAEEDDGLAYASDYDENGKPRNSTDAGTRRCGWLGSARGRRTRQPG
jgi:hypothetical protein